jgi:cbb3-type cytochrome c oxidase subunit II
MREQPTVARVVTVTVLLWLAAALVTVLLPIGEPQADGPTVEALTWRDYPAFESGALSVQAADALPAAGLQPEVIVQGREVYIREGCTTCHTQQVRAVVTDVGLGPVTRYGDVIFEDPEVLGSERIGPDLMHAGSREPTDDVAWVIQHLRDPRAIRPWSAMPSYAHLSETDLAALAEYVVSLK